MSFALRKRKSNNNHQQVGTVAPALRINTRRAQIEEFLKESGGYGHKLKEFEERFDFPGRLRYKSFRINFKGERMKKYVNMLDDMFIEEMGDLQVYYIKSKFVGDEQDVLINIIKLSYAMDVIKESISSKVVYNVLKTIALISLNERGDLVLQDCYHLLDPEDTKALFGDIIRKHSGYIMASLDTFETLQESKIKSSLRRAKNEPQAFTFQLPPEIILNGAGPSSSYLFIDTVNKKVLPEIGLVDVSRYIHLFVMSVVQQALAMALPVVVINEILKTITQMRVSEESRLIIFDPPIEGLEEMIEPVKNDLMALLLQKMAKHNNGNRSNRKRKSNNNHQQVGTVAPALCINARRAQIERFLKDFGRHRPTNFEENFNFPSSFIYRSFRINFTEEKIKKYVKMLDDLFIEGNGTLNTQTIQEKNFAEDEEDELINIIRLSYAMDVIQDLFEIPKVVYNVLKEIAFISLNERGDLVLQDCYNLLDPEDTKALFGDIIRTHGDYILKRLESDQLKQDLYIEDVLRRAQSEPQAFKFQLPPEIIVHGPSSFLFIDTLHRFISPEIEEIGLIDASRYIHLFVLSVLQKALAMAVPVVVIYKILKTITQMRVSEESRTIVFDPAIEGLEALLANVKNDLMALLLQKKANHNARVSSLVTKKVAMGANGLSSIDMLFLCGDKECAPVRNSDQLLSWLKNEKYAASNFSDKVLQTLEIINPAACFLPQITHSYNVTEGTGQLYLYSRKGENGRTKEEIFDPIKYKKEQIDTCAARVMQSGRRKVAQGVRRLSYARQERPLIAIPFGLYIFGKDFGHANMLIIDPNKRECEHFEPHGEKMGMKNKQSGIKYKEVIERVAMDVCNQLFPGYTYIPRSKATNFQSMLNRKFAGSPYSGTCKPWCLWYAYLRLSHPEFPREVILQRSYDLLAQNDFAELENFIVKFMTQLNSIAGIYKVGDKFYTSNGIKA